MNEWLQLAIHVGVGAVAGLVTNGLAVISLFRPHRAPKLGPFELRAFQGVIPKRIDALAESIGRLVEEELLTDEVVKDILLSDDTKQFVGALVVDGAVHSLLNDRRTLEQIGGEVLGFGPETLHRSAPRWLQEQLLGVLQRDETAAVVEEWLADAGRGLLDAPVSRFTESDLYFALRYGLRDRLRDVLAGGGLKRQLLAALDRRLGQYESSSLTLGEFVPGRARTQIRRWVLAEGPELADQLVTWLNSPGMTDHLQEIIDGVIDSFPLLGQWVARRFDKRHDLAGQIVLQLTLFLHSPDNQKQLLGLVSQWLDKLWSLPLSEVVERLGRDNIRGMAEQLLDGMLTIQRADAVLDRIDAWLRAEAHRPWREVLSFGLGAEADPALEQSGADPAPEQSGADPALDQPGAAQWRATLAPTDAVRAPQQAAVDPTAAPSAHPEPDFDSRSDGGSAPGHGTKPPSVFHRIAAAILHSETAERLVESTVASQWERVLALTPAHMTARLRISDLQQARSIVFGTYERLVTNIPPGTVAKLPIAAHIESHVKSLPLPVVERQLRSVLGREMRAVTFMGAWLGLVVGALGYVVQKLMGP